MIETLVWKHRGGNLAGEQGKALRKALHLIRILMELGVIQVQNGSMNSQAGMPRNQ